MKTQKMQKLISTAQTEVDAAQEDYEIAEQALQDATLRKTNTESALASASLTLESAVD